MPAKEQGETFCPPIFSGQFITCRKELCIAWDNDRGQCLLRLYLAGYLKHQILDLKMMALYDDLKKEFDNRQGEF